MLKNEAHACLLIYLILACPSLLIISLVTPQFHVPDEPSHYMRAYQVYKGNFFPTKKLPDNSKKYKVGGMVDTGIAKLDRIITSIAYDKHKKITPDMKLKISRISWDSERFHNAPNISIYPPFFYIPAAAGVWLAKKYDLLVADAVTVSRWCNISVGIILSGLAIVLSRQCAFLVTTILLFPIVLSQMASTSQDSLMFPVSALTAALLVQIHTTVSTSKVLIYSVIVAFFLVLISTSRPPYTALGLLLAATAIGKSNNNHKKILIISSCVAILSSFLWAYYVARYVSVPFGHDGVSYMGQLHFIIDNPWDFLRTLVLSIFTWGVSWIAQIVGILGWLDTVLPAWFYGFSGISVSIMVILFICENPAAQISGKLTVFKLCSAAILLITFLGMLLVMYVVWTPVGHKYILGFQGRYLLPLVFLSALLLLRKENSSYSGRYTKHRLIILAGSGLTGIIVSITTIIERYYP